MTRQVQSEPSETLEKTVLKVIYDMGICQGKLLNATNNTEVK